MLFTLLAQELWTGRKRFLRPGAETRTGAVCVGYGNGFNSLPVNTVRTETSNMDGGQFDDRKYCSEVI